MFLCNVHVGLLADHQNDKLKNVTVPKLCMNLYQLGSIYRVRSVRCLSVATRGRDEEHTGT
jgi:hypothetical protein